MKPKVRAKTAGRRRTRRSRPQPFDLLLEKSVGYQVRMTDRALQRYLQAKIGPHGVTLGMWYFLPGRRVDPARAVAAAREQSHDVDLVRRRAYGAAQARRAG